jgi:hypothetical protein
MKNKSRMLTEQQGEAETLGRLIHGKTVLK